MWVLKRKPIYYTIDMVILMILKHVVDAESAGKTVKYILKNKLHISERLIKKLKYGGGIFLNSVPVYVNTIVNESDIVEAVIKPMGCAEGIVPEKIDIDIIYEDNCMLVLNKPPNYVVHPTSSHPSGTIANAVAYYFSEKGEQTIVRPVSRLDRDTSGIIIFAKNPFVQDALIRQMRNKEFKKYYIGITEGRIEKDAGTIDLPIARKSGSIMLRHISEDGAPSVTHYKVLERFIHATLVEFNLETGRTHQIRVHCQAIGHPLLGDTLYSGMQTCLINRQALHSAKVRFIHPLSNANMELYAPLPEDIKHALEILRK